MDITEEQVAAIEALIEHAEEEVTGGMEAADELIDVDADVRSLLTGGITFQDEGTFLTLLRSAGVEDADAVLEEMEDQDILSIEEAVYDRDQDGTGRKRAIVTVDEGVLDAVMTG